MLEIHFFGVYGLVVGAVAVDVGLRRRRQLALDLLRLLAMVGLAENGADLLVRLGLVFVV